jgi:misacylated tRNA(Ala) deacylase
MSEQLEKQFDPRMHSAEHITNQTMVRLFQSGRCFSAHIEKKKSKLDYRFDRPLSDEEIGRLEEQVNRVIQADMPVNEEFMPRAEAERSFNLERLPEEAGDILRIIRIGDYDACPCIGPHVKSTAGIGRFRIISSSFENGVLRIRYKLDKPAPQAWHTCHRHK